MTLRRIEKGFYYEAELQRMGYAEDGTLTSDEEGWVHPDAFHCWNIWCTFRDSDGDYLDDICDIDIPKELKFYAKDCYMEMTRRVRIANELRINIYDLH